ncbi:ATP-binding protein [Patescibacteria group bacterium]|nr:ATP-binding protein [Patescibacteria group bacterium]
MRKPLLIILGGFAGAGKSTLARRLSREYNFPLFSSDDFIEATRKAIVQEFHAVAPIAYDVMWHILDQHLKNAVSLILDANMCHSRTWQQVDEREQRFTDYKILPILLECPLEVHKARIEQRAIHEPEHFNLGGDTFEDILPKYEFIRALNREQLIRINADRPLNEVYLDVQKKIEEYACLDNVT